MRQGRHSHACVTLPDRNNDIDRVIIAGGIGEGGNLELKTEILHLSTGEKLFHKKPY